MSSEITPTAGAQRATPVLSGAEQVQRALAMEDLLARREATVAAVAAYLADAEVMAMADTEVSDRLTEVALSSGRVVLPDPVFVRRAPGQPEVAVVGLPDGMGLALYDMREPGREPHLLTAWTAGLEQVYVTWAEDVHEAGVAYITLGADRQRRAHYLLALDRESDNPGWEVAWYSDEVPDWWLNGFNGQLEVAPDLSTLTLVGNSDGTTLTFDEAASGVRRDFYTTWERNGTGYEISPPPRDYESRQAWLWQIAQPSPYATLVEFVERLREEDEGGASRLATSSVHALTAVQLGLALPPRRYTVLEQTEDSLIFGDEAGVYQVKFISPQREGEKWLIVDVVPLTFP